MRPLVATKLYPADRPAVPETKSEDATSEEPIFSELHHSTLLASNSQPTHSRLFSTLHLLIHYPHYFNRCTVYVTPYTSPGAMYAGRTASRAAPAVFRAGIRTTTRAHRPMLRNSPAIRILIPLRALQTESTSNNAQNYPPPGFDPKQANQHLLKPQQQSKQSVEKSDPIIPKSGATSNPKTPAQDVQTLSELKMDKSAAESKDEKKILAKRDAEKKKLTVWQKVKKELVHYWDGTKLLGFEVRISSKLALKMAAGYELTRRERRQVRV